MPLEVKLKGPPNEDLVQGFPGIPATWPRVAGTVEIRYLPQGKGPVEPLDVRRVTVGVFRTDSIVLPSHRPSMAAPKREKSFLITRQKEILSGAVANDVFALDVPFTLSLPTQRTPTASISLAKKLESVHHVFITVETGSAKTNHQFPVRVRRFDTLSTFGTFHRPLTGDVPSVDHLVNLEWSLPVSAYGPGDILPLQVRIQPNKDWPKSKKVKVKRISVELVEVTKFVDPETPSQHASGTSQTTKSVSLNTAAGSSASEPEVQETRSRIGKTAREFSSADQDDKVGIATAIKLELKIPVGLNPDDKGTVLAKEQPEIGYDGKVGFTTSSPLYSVDFKLVIKVRLSHAKDIETEHPITLSQFDHSTCLIYMNHLVEAARTVKHIDRRPQPPRVWSEPMDSKIKLS